MIANAKYRFSDKKRNKACDKRRMQSEICERDVRSLPVMQRMI